MKRPAARTAGLRRNQSSRRLVPCNWVPITWDNQNRTGVTKSLGLPKPGLTASSCVPIKFVTSHHSDFRVSGKEAEIQRIEPIFSVDCKRDSLR